MKYCEEYAALLDLYVDGELPPEEMVRVGDHVASCPGCQAYVDDALAIRAGFGDLEDTEAPEGFAEGVMERIRAQSGEKTEKSPGTKRAGRRWMGTLAALAACCAIVVLLRAGPGRGGMEMTAAPAGAGGAAASGTVCGGDFDAGGESEEGIAAYQASGAEAPEVQNDSAESRSAQEYSADSDIWNTSGADESWMEAEGEASEKTASYEGVAMGPAAAAPEEASTAEPVLRLTAEEAGDLLDGFTPILDNVQERRYELTGGEYAALLEGLGRTLSSSEAEKNGGTVLVIVKGPF